MTTIAYRDGVMASDSGLFRGSTREYSISKIVTIDGALVGTSGYLSDVLKFRQWFAKGARLKKYPVQKKREFRAIVVQPGGMVEMYDNYDQVPAISIHEYVAIGSGQDVALGAMAAGASAAAAIKAAIEHDNGTKGPVQVCKLRSSK